MDNLKKSLLVFLKRQLYVAHNNNNNNTTVNSTNMRTTTPPAHQTANLKMIWFVIQNCDPI